MSGCVGCGGGIVKGSFFNPPDTMDTVIRRAATKVLSGRASYIRMTVKGADVSICPWKDIGGYCVRIVIDYPDGSSDVSIMRE